MFSQREGFVGRVFLVVVFCRTVNVREQAYGSDACVAELSIEIFITCRNIDFMSQSLWVA